MNPRIAHLALLLLAASGFASGPAVARFEDDGCRIAFDHPPEMSVHRVSGPAPIGTLDELTPLCSLGIADPGWAAYREKSRFDEPEHPVTIDVFEGSFDELARAAGFIQVGTLREIYDDPAMHAEMSASDWTLPSRGPNAPATAFGSGARKGIRGIGWSRKWVRGECDEENDGCIGSVYYEVGVVCERLKCAIVYSHDESAFRDVVDCVFESFTGDADPTPRDASARF